LLAGDVVCIPDRKRKASAASTGHISRFVVRGVPAKLRLRIVEHQPERAPPPSAAPAAGPASPAGGLLDSAQAIVSAAAEAIGASSSGKRSVTADPPRQPVRLKLVPRANLPYELVVDGKRISGKTDGDGNIVETIAPNARTATLTLEPGTPRQRPIDIKLGALDPLDTVPGAKQRLANLGFEFHQEDPGSFQHPQ
jgi:hypothetical protein